MKKKIQKMLALCVAMLLMVNGSVVSMAKESEHAKCLRVLAENGIEVSKNDTVTTCTVYSETGEAVSTAVCLQSENGEACSDTFVIEYESDNNHSLISPLASGSGTRGTVTVTGYYYRQTKNHQYYYRPYQVSFVNTARTDVSVDYRIGGCQFTNGLVDTNNEGTESIVYNVASPVRNRTYSKTRTAAYYYLLMGSPIIIHRIFIEVGGNYYYVEMPYQTIV